MKILDNQFTVNNKSTSVNNLYTYNSASPVNYIIQLQDKDTTNGWLQLQSYEVAIIAS